MASSGLIPDLGSSGTFTLKAPFNASIKSTRVYTCIAIRRLSEIVAGGADAEAAYYSSPYSLDASVYQTDLANGVSIITLQSSTGELVHVPSSYITAYPKGGGVNYSVVGLAVNLGAIPTTLDLTTLKDTIKQACQDKLGVTTATVTEATLSAVEQVSSTDHANMETARTAAISTPATERARALAAETTVTACQAKISALEAYILAMEKQNSSTGVSTPDFTAHYAWMSSFSKGETLSDTDALTLSGYLQTLDQQTTASKWTADNTVTEYSVAGATVVYNGKVSTDFPADANFSYVLVLSLRDDVTVPTSLLFLNYNALSN